MTTYWDKHILNHDTYIRSYGEGEGSENRKMIFKYLEPHQSVLDVGCGNGINLGHALQMGFMIDYMGVDSSKMFIKSCKKRFPDWKGKFVVGDANNLLFLDKSFDVVILQDVLEHLEYYDKAINEALRIAKKRVIICLWRQLHDSPDFLQPKGLDINEANTYNRQSFEDFIHSSGWTIEKDYTDHNREHWYYILTRNI